MGNVQMGDDVFYVMEFDSDKSMVPNIGPAKVTKVATPSLSGVPAIVDLVVFSENGVFFKQNVHGGDASSRGCWFSKEVKA